MSVVRGRPPGLGRGIIGSIRRYWSSLSAWPAPKSPTNTRSAGLHILVSRKDRSSSPTATSGGGAHFTRSQPPFQNGLLDGVRIDGMSRHVLIVAPPGTGPEGRRAKAAQASAEQARQAWCWWSVLASLRA